MEQKAFKLVGFGKQVFEPVAVKSEFKRADAAMLNRDGQSAGLLAKGHFGIRPQMKKEKSVQLFSKPGFQLFLMSLHGLDLIKIGQKLPTFWAEAHPIQWTQK